MEEYDEPGTAEAYYLELRRRLEALPEVAGASGVSALPLSGGAAQAPVALEEWSADMDPDRLFVSEGVVLHATGTTWQGEDVVMADLNTALPGYFRSMGIELLAGRGFGADELRPGATTVVLDESLAGRFWSSPDEAVGRQVWLGGDWREVVGVVDHARLYDLQSDGRPQAYLPYTRMNSGRVSMVATADGVDPASLEPLVRDVVRSMDPMVPVADVRTVESTVAEATARERFGTWVMGGFAAAVTLLAALGMYGVLSFTVGQRRREMAVRMAMGSGPLRLAARVVGEGMRLAATGAAVGLLGAVAAGRALDGILVGVAPDDPPISGDRRGAHGPGVAVGLLAAREPGGGAGSVASFEGGVAPGIAVRSPASAPSASTPTGHPDRPATRRR